MYQSNKLDYLLIILCLFFITGLYFPTTDSYIVSVLIFVVILFKKKRLIIDAIFYKLIYFIIIINLISIVFWGMVEINTFLGILIRLSIPYFILKIIGKNYFNIFTKIIFFLAIWSIPFYILQIIQPNIYSNLSPLFEFMNEDIRYKTLKHNYLFHTVHFADTYRNCGIFWEPGGFAAILMITISYKFLTNKFRFDKKIILMLIVGLSTFSTAFYTYLLFLISFFLYEKKVHPLVWSFFLPIAIYLFYLIFNLPFMGEKMNEMAMDSQMILKNRLEGVNYDGIGRFAGLIIDFYDFLKYPIGYGINYGGKIINAMGDYIGGPNGFGRFLRMWGVIGIVFLFYSLKKFGNYFRIKYSLKTSYLFLITIFIALFSNPIEREPIFIIILYYSLMFIDIKKKNTSVINLKTSL